MGSNKRFTVVALCFLAVFICYLDRVNMSVSSVAMKEAFGWSETVKGFVLSSFFVGYLAMQVVGGVLAHRFGGKLVLGIAVVWWSVFTMLTPMAAFTSLAVLIIFRIALGLGEAATFPASFALFSDWVPAKERSRSISILLSGAPLGSVAALLTTGWLVEHLGWPSVFYIFGVVGLFWAVFWFWRIFEEPAMHPHISMQEHNLLRDNKNNKVDINSIPWLSIFSKMAVWALIINHFSTNWTTYILLAWLPSYFRDVHGMSIMNAGFYSAAPWLIMFVMMIFSGWLADLLLKTGMSTLFVRKLMQAVALFGSAFFLMLLRDINTPLEATLTMCGALGLLAATTAGFGPNALEIAPRYSGILAGITNTAATIPGIVGVIVTGWLVDLTGSYASAFALAAGINIIGGLIWLLFARAEPVVD